MAEKNELIEQMLEHLVNDDQQKAEELFHEYVVAKSREIYEGLIDSEIAEEEEKDQDDEDDEDTDVEENFDELAAEASPEMDDETDDLEMELDAEGDDDDDMEEKSEEELFQDLDAIVDELQAKFDELKGDEGDMDDMGDDEEMKDDFELETVREYVEKVPAGHGAEKKGAAEKADNTKSTIDNMKNDMGGTTANLRGGEAKEASKGTAGGLANNKPQDMKTGNVNVPGGKAGKTGFTHKEPGHGAEKKGAAEGSTDGQSLFRGRR
jgi:hypothetical protein